MANVHDTAAYILEKRGPLSAMKLQKLAYYSQAWSLVWDDCHLFDERIEAWANGPVTPVLYQAHSGQFSVSQITKGDSGRLTQDQKDTVDAVLESYGAKSAQWLSDLTHLEDPWKNARGDCPEGTRCSNEITKVALSEYYGSLPPNSSSV